MLGNSSSGIVEAASFNLPVINLGTRQDGKIKPKNVFDVNYKGSQLFKLILSLKKKKTENVSFIYEALQQKILRIIKTNYNKKQDALHTYM